MVARADGAAQLSLYVVVFVCLFIISFGFIADCITFDWAQLLLFSNNHAGFNFDTFAIPLEILCTAATTGVNIVPAKWRQRQRERKQKRGKGAGLHARRKDNPHRPALPSLFLTSCMSLTNKVAELRKGTSQHCMTIITETWLNHNLPDVAIEVASCSVNRADHTRDSVGGGVCVYVNNSWCTHTDISL